jgi:YesN/AraC family two-component response regulator
MPGLDNRSSREAKKIARVIPGARALHRGIHITENRSSVKQYRSNARAEAKGRADPRDLMVHHQKLNDDLQDVYRRATELKKDDLTKEERIEEGWKAFERIGGKRPQQKVGYAKHLEQVRAARKDERARAEVERYTGDVDWAKGSALHDMKDRRVKKFVQKQVDRAHLLKRMGDPTPMKQTGKFDRFSNTFTMHNKAQRQVRRQTRHDERESTLKSGRGGKKRSTMWDVRNDGGINATPTKHLRDDSAALRLGRNNKGKRNTAKRSGGRR